MISRIRRGFAAIALSGVAAFACAAFPERPITLIVPWAAGGSTDILARGIGAQLAERWGQPFVVENRPGAGGNIGTEMAVRATPDGYTLIVNSVGPIAVNPTLYRKLGANPLTDLVPIVQIAEVPNVLVVHPSLPVKSIEEFVAYAKANPGKLKYGSSGIGTSIHLTSELFRNAAGVDLTHIPYKGAAPALTDLLGGQIDLMFPGITPVVAHVKSGKLRAIGLTSLKRSPALPDLPTMHELGIANFQSIGWYGVLVPAGTPAEVIATLNAVVVKAVQKPDFRARLAQLGADPLAESPEYFRKMLAEEIARWAKVVRISKAKPE